MAVQNKLDMTVYPYALFTAPEMEMSKLMLGVSGILFEFPIGTKLLTPQKAVIIRDDEDHYRIYGFDTEIVEWGGYRLPLDLKETLSFIIDHRINRRTILENNHG